MLTVQAEAIKPFLQDEYSRADIDRLLEFLERAGTFQFTPLENGLFPAALSLQEDYEYTGYSNVWVRDNVLVSHGLYASGRVKPAVRCLMTLADYFWKYRQRFEDIISGAADPNDPMQRPHIRINGTTLSENDQQWAHAQNDALGYFLWLYCKLIRAGHVPVSRVQPELLTLFVNYLHAIRFWEDEDNGHWEEAKKIEASSIGTATAGLLELNQLLEQHPDLQYAAGSPCEQIDRLEEAITLGRIALDRILPCECIQPDPLKYRAHDAALLFLVEPLGIVQGAMADRIIADVNEHLLGEYGIRRYIGDSYWCADYKDKLEPEQRTNDFSEDQSSRDKLLSPGEEAQWCIFDPILSIIHGRRFQQSGETKDRLAQIHHLHRALAQLTGESSDFGALRCPESYYLVQGRYVPNDITPLLWTQANLLLALHVARQTSP